MRNELQINLDANHSDQTFYLSPNIWQVLCECLVYECVEYLLVNKFTKNTKE